jgi:hypothetical protein
MEAACPMPEFDEENFISGVHNYCDRWCERCSLTARCRVYAMEQERDEQFDPDDPNSLFRILSQQFAETRQMIEQWAEEAGVDLATLANGEEAFAKYERDRKLARQNDLVQRAEKYAKMVGAAWPNEAELRALAETENPFRLEELLEVIGFYRFSIAVKLFRGIHSRMDEDEEDAGPSRDSDGSIKVALICLDRSLAAWSALAVPPLAAKIKPVILHLEKLRRDCEQAFPHARDFIRPGFDELPDAYVF